MKLFSIQGNSQKLDGGAMYGNCPRALWTRWSTPDEQNRIDLACRALLIRDGERVILAETGVGAYMEPKMRDRFGVVESEHVLLESLARVGVSQADVTHVVVSHLHFDHAGGLLTPYAEGEAPGLLFERATYLVGARAFERAEKPHPRDRASFIPGLTDLLRESGRLHLVDHPTDHPLGPRYRFHFTDGHTPGSLHLEILEPHYVFFAADLMPGTPWVHIPITMGYDRFPERLVDEKRAVLEEVLRRDGFLFYTHDPVCAMSKVARDDRGRFQAVERLERLDAWG